MSSRRLLVPCAAALLGLGLGLPGCSGGLAVPVPRLVVDTESLTFADIHAGERHRQSIQLTNHGTRSVRVTLTADEPLVLTADALALAPEGTSRVDVIVEVDSYEAFTAEVHIRGGDVQVDVPVSVTVDPDWDGDGAQAIGAGGTDCDDDRADVLPGADERCDEVDNDCDGAVDEDAVDRIEVWPDLDGDLWGADGTPELQCAVSAALVDRPGDCDDADRNVNPDAVETADGDDEDCDGMVDEHLLVPGALVITEVYLDPRAADPGVPPYVELEVQTAGVVHLQGVQVTLGGETLALEAATATDGDLLVLCGVGAAAAIGGEPCDGPLPARPTLDDVLVLFAEVELDRLDWTGWTFPADGALELDPSAADAVDNDRRAAWCDATLPMSNGDSGSPGQRNGACP